MPTIFLISGHGQSLASWDGTLSDCGDWSEARSDIMLTRLRPDTFTLPGYVPPQGSTVQSPDIEFWATENIPWDERIMGDSLPHFYEPFNTTYSPPLGDNVTNSPTSQFHAALSLNPLNEPRRAPYTIIGHAFQFPLVVGRVHTIHTDICLMDGATCRQKPEGTGVPVYAMPEPASEDDAWIPLTSTWWGTLTVEEQEALTGDATGKDIPHPKGILSSMKDGDALEQLRQRITWTLTEPAGRTDLFNAQDPTFEQEPFYRVVPHARLDVSIPGVYEVELAVDGGEGEQLVVDKTRFISLDVDAHWPGTMGNPGPLVSDYDETDPLNLFTIVNNGDDNFDMIADNDPVGSPTVEPGDDDIITVVVRHFIPPVPGGGTLELSTSSDVRFFTADGTQALTLPLTVNFANPSGPLADILNQDVTLLMEANAPSADAVLVLAYKQEGQELCRDEVHLAVIAPEIQGGFTPGSVRYSEALVIDPENWMIFAELSTHHPLSLLIRCPDELGENAMVRFGKTQDTMMDTLPLTMEYFGWLAAGYNGLARILGTPQIYTAVMLAEEFAQAAGVATDDLVAGQYFAVPPLTESGLYDVGFCRDDLCTNQQEHAHDTGTIHLFVAKIDLDIHRSEGQGGLEVTDDYEENPGAFPNVHESEHLVELVIRRPEVAGLAGEPYTYYHRMLKILVEGYPVMLNIVSGQEQIRLWQDVEQQQEIPLEDTAFGPADLDIEDNSWGVPPSIWKTMWVEVTQPSETLRDIELELEFMGGKDAVRATAIELDFVKMWDTDNQANQIYNPTLKDDPNKPFPVARNRLYLVEAPDDGQYHMTLEVDDMSALRNTLMYAIFREIQVIGGDPYYTKYEGTDGFFPATGPAHIVFDHPEEAFTDFDDFTVLVGYDVNGNALLDQQEVITFPSLVNFQLSEQSLEHLEDWRDSNNQGIPEDILKDLHHMKDYGFRTEDEFYDAVEYCIGIAEAWTYRTPILEYATLSGERPNEPIVRGTEEEYYPNAKWVIDEVVKGRTNYVCPALPGALEHTPYLVQIFRDGAIDTLDPNKSEYHPNADLTTPIIFNCFDKWNSSAGTFSEWLTHNAGAPFNDTGIAQIQEYTWARQKPLAKSIATSYQVMEALRSHYFSSDIQAKINAYFANKGLGQAVLPRDDPQEPSPFYTIPHEHKSPQWVPKTTIEFDEPGEPTVCDDLAVGIGRGRLVRHEAQYVIEKRLAPPDFMTTELVLIQVNTRGELQDLYDYNRDGGLPAGEAATLQIGHGNGSYGQSRKFGVIYRLKVIFDEPIPDPF